jgi:hypothetical protein
MDLGNTPYSEGYHSPRYWSPPGHHGWDSPNEWATYATYSPPDSKAVDTPTWSPSHLPYSTSTSQRSTPENHDHVLGDSEDAPSTSDEVHPPSSTQLANTTTTTRNVTNSDTKLRSGGPQHSNHFVSAGVLLDFGGPVGEKSVARQTDINGEHAGHVQSTVCRRLYRFII